MSGRKQVRPDGGSGLEGPAAPLPPPAPSNSRPSGANAARPPTTWPKNTPALPPGPANQPRVWLHIDDQGKASYVQVEKQSLVQTLGIPYRDLRILDPLVPMPYPTAIFIREKALVVNLETIKMIICKDQMFLLSVVDMNQPDKPAKPQVEHHFVADLCRRLKSPGPLKRESANVNMDTDLPYELRALEAALAEVNKVLEHEVTALEQDAWAALENLTKKVSRAALESVRRVKTRLNRLTARIGKLREELEDLMDDDEDMADMYLGLRAEREARDEAEREAQEAHHVATGAAAQWEPEGDHILGTGDYGHEDGQYSPRSEPAQWSSALPLMTAEEEQMHQAKEDAAPHGPQGLPAEPGEAEPMADSVPAMYEDAFSTPADGSLPDTLPSTHPAAPAPPPEPTSGSSKRSRSKSTPKPVHAGEGAAMLKRGVVQTLGLIDPFQRRIHKTSKLTPGDPSIHEEEHQTVETFPETPVVRWSGPLHGQGGLWSSVDPHDIEGVEALLEAYFMQVDFSMSRLVILKERIDDTEDLINIELDSRRNELVALEVILTTMTLVFSIISAVGGIFGMNLKSGMEEEPHVFYIVTSMSVVAAISAFVAIVIYCRRKRLMFMGVPSKI